MKKAVPVARTYGNLPAYEVLKISDYSDSKASCWDKQELFFEEVIALR
jgi:hypothetical protein